MSEHNASLVLSAHSTITRTVGLGDCIWQFLLPAPCSCEPTMFCQFHLLHQKKSRMSSVFSRMVNFSKFFFSNLNKCTKAGQIQWYHWYVPEPTPSTMLRQWLCHLLPLLLCSCHYEVNIKQWVLNFSAYQDPLEDLLKHRLLSSLPLLRVSGSVKDGAWEFAFLTGY